MFFICRKQKSLLRVGLWFHRLQLGRQDFFSTFSDCRPQAPVVIAGAGPTGLVTALLLARYDVPSVVLERSPSLTIHPRAHFINHRTMEIFRSIDGLSHTVSDSMPVLDEWRSFVYCSSMVGDKSSIIGIVDHFLNQRSPHNLSVSPEPVAHLSQHKLLPLLAERAEKAKSSRQGSEMFGKNMVDIRFGHVVKEIHETPGKVMVRVQKKQAAGSYQKHFDSKENYVGSCDERSQDMKNNKILEETIEAQFVVAADGAHSSIRKQLGIGFSGPGPMQHLINIHFKSEELSHMLLASKRCGMLYFVFNANVIAVIVAHSLQDGEFVAQIPYFPPLQTGEDISSKKAAIDFIRKAAGVPSLQLDVLEIRPWTLSAYVADEYLSQGRRIILAGDAVHVVPPSGALGMNTGVQDAHNLAWKLAIAVKQDRGRDLIESSNIKNLLDSYCAERKPVAEANMWLSVANFNEALRVAELMGLDYRTANAFNDVLNSKLTSWIPQHVKKSILESSLSLGRMAGAAIGAIRQDALQALFLEGETLRLQYPKEDLGFIYAGDKTSISLENEFDSNGKNFKSPNFKSDHLLVAEYLRPQARNAPYIPTTLPGARFPHIPLKVLQEGHLKRSVSKGSVVSSIDIVPASDLDFTLFVSKCPDMHDWLAVCKANFIDGCNEGVVQSVLPVVVVPSEDSDLISSIDKSVSIVLDVQRKWTTIHQYGDFWKNIDAVLVRPDGHVAWRTQAVGTTLHRKAKSLENAMEKALGNF